MSYIRLSVEDIKTLVEARDICALHSKTNPQAQRAHEILLGVLRMTALDPNMED